MNVRKKRWTSDFNPKQTKKKQLLGNHTVALGPQKLLQPMHINFRSSPTYFLFVELKYTLELYYEIEIVFASLHPIFWARKRFKKAQYAHHFLTLSLKQLLLTHQIRIINWTIDTISPMWKNPLSTKKKFIVKMRWLTDINADIFNC